MLKMVKAKQSYHDPHRPNNPEKEIRRSVYISVKELGIPKVQ